MVLIMVCISILHKYDYNLNTPVRSSVSSVISILHKYDYNNPEETLRGCLIKFQFYISTIIIRACSPFLS